MNVLEVLRILVALVTIATGLISLIKPRSVTGFTGLEPRGARGIAELRSVLGGTFLGLGIAPLLLGGEAYTMLGLTYAVIGAARAASIAIDKSTEQSNLISLVVEIVCAIILLV